jgi:acetate kinase
MEILALNFGTSTLKYALLRADDAQPAPASVIDRPATPASAIAAVRRAMPPGRVPDAVVHRVVHGGPHRSAPAVVDRSVERDIEAQLPLAPQHNLLALEGLRTARAMWPEAVHVAVFDTAFHAQLPEHASCYAVPAAWRKAGLRRYGFHGLSHRHVMDAVAQRFARDASALRIVSCHLGNGASACAIAHGRSVDTSMGLTPLEGLIMGTRSGDLDPGAHAFVARTLGLQQAEIERVLYEQSGVAALGGHGGDLRLIEAAAAAGDAQADLALAAYAYRIRKYIGAYAAAMGGCDTVAFTGGVGEHSAGVRRRVLAQLDFLGLLLDEDRNQEPQLDDAGVAELQALGSPARILLVQAREEWAMVREALRLLRPT